HISQEDVKMMKDMNLDSYRFSISWPRILPSLEPYVTLFHWDLPQALEDEYGGFLSSHIVDDFRDYEDLCFKEFGDRVKFWVTLNQPWLFSQGGYATGPGRCTGPQCLGGDAGNEPYIVTHNQILAHAAAVHVYKTKYQAYQKVKIGITLVSNWFIPLAENNTSDIKAARRAIDFRYGWFMEPLTKGEYPRNMRALVGSRLPKFSKWQAKLVNGSFDFIGLNYYSSGYINGVPPSNAKPSFLTDSRTNTTFERNGRPLGMNEFNDPILPVEEDILDICRIDYYYRHFYYLRSAIKAGPNVKGFFAWSFLDCNEWFAGFTVRFGFNFVDYKDGLKRYPKLSAQ
ncbi:Non-cyanogenic beta-glucosidase, partial [Glycine soja]